MPTQQPPAVNHYKIFLDGMKETETVSRLAQEAKGSIEPDKAAEELKKYAFNFWRTHPLTANWTPTNPSQLTPQDIQEGVSKGVEIASKRATQAIDQNLEEIVDKNIKDGTLKTLLATNQVASRIAESDQEVVARYNDFKRFEEFANRYATTNKAQNQHEEKIVVEAAVRGYAEAEKERMKNFSPAEQEMAKAFAARAAARRYRPETTSKYAKEGLKTLAKDREKEYTELVKSKGRDVTGIVRETIKSIKKSEDKGGLSSTEREKFYGLIYAAETGKIKYKGPTFADYARMSNGDSDQNEE